MPQSICLSCFNSKAFFSVLAWPMHFFWIGLGPLDESEQLCPINNATRLYDINLSLYSLLTLSVTCVSLDVQFGKPVRAYLPPDTLDNRKKVYLKQLFTEFDAIDGKPTKKQLEVGGMKRIAFGIEI